MYAVHPIHNRVSSALRSLGRLTLATATCLALSAGSASAFSKGNSQDKIPANLHLGDIDGDGLTDFIQFNQNKLFAMKTDSGKTGILHHYFNQNVTRPLIGDFMGEAHDQVCAVLANNTLECFGTSPDKEELWWAFTQSNFIGSTDETMIGDFNNDGQDDLMLYNTTSGSIRFYTVNSTGFFATMSNSNLGNLSAVAVTGMRLRVGDFNGDGRSDILAINSAGQVMRYDSVYSNGVNTFWWAFTSSSGVVPSGYQATLARINDDFTDDLVLHNNTGTYRFWKIIYQNGNLTPISDVNTSSLPTGSNKLLFWGTLRTSDSAEPGGDVRDDLLAYDTAASSFYRSDARYENSKYVYYNQYSTAAPAHNTGWATVKTNKWLALLCKFSDQNAEPHDMNFYKRYFTQEGAGADGVYDYFLKASYGSLTLAGTQVKGWYRMSISLAQAQSLNRTERVQACINASALSTSGYQGVIAVINANLDSGASGAGVLSDPGANDHPSFIAHELLHQYGMPHSWDDSDRQAAEWSAPGEYMDPWDVMSAMAVYNYDTAEFGWTGPELNAPYKTRMAWLPTTRTTTFTPGSSKVTKTITVAAINRPEASGPLQVKIGFPNESTSSHYYTIEYRKKWGLDRAIPRNTVLIHEYVDGLTYLLGYDVGQEWLPGETFSGANGVKIKVNSIASTGDTASVTVTY